MVACGRSDIANRGSEVCRTRWDGRFGSVGKDEEWIGVVPVNGQPNLVVRIQGADCLAVLSHVDAVLLVVACGLAYVLSSRITRPIVTLAESLKGAPDRTPIAPRDSGVKEVEELEELAPFG